MSLFQLIRVTRTKPIKTKIIKHKNMLPVWSSSLSNPNNFHPTHNLQRERADWQCSCFIKCLCQSMKAIMMQTVQTVQQCRQAICCNSGVESIKHSRLRFKSTFTWFSGCEFKAWISKKLNVDSTCCYRYIWKCRSELALWQKSFRLDISCRQW